MARRVLLVDDDTDFLAVLAIALESDDTYVETVATFQQALGTIERRTFDVVLSDFLLRVATPAEGWAQADALRAAAAPTPVVLLSGFHLDPATVAARGFAAFLLKPFGLGDLLALLDTVAPARPR